MVENLLEYYERELTFLRRLGGEFSRRYPKIAKRLLLEPDKCDDPHVERILEGVAFLAARVHRKLDEEFPEIAGSFIESLLPHYLQPIPSLSIAQVHPKPGKWLDLPAGVQLQTRLIRAYNTRCKFRTCLPVQSWPVVVSELSWASPGTLRLPSELSCPSVLRMILRCTEGSFAALRPPHARDTLRLYLDGPRQFALYEVLLSCSASQLSPQVLLRTTDGALVPLSLRPVGFEPSEGLLPYSGRSFLGQRLLTEYFAFPSKFLFVDLGGLSEKIRSRLDERAEVLFLSGIPAGTLIPQLDDVKLGCVPIVNLFAQPAEPINLSPEQSIASFRMLVIRTPPRSTPLRKWWRRSLAEVKCRSIGRCMVCRIDFLPLWEIRKGVSTMSRVGVPKRTAARSICRWSIAAFPRATPDMTRCWFPHSVPIDCSRGGCRWGRRGAPGP